ncbi:MAG: hypothetical protein QY306_11310 [Anaerolineales bacterium]|nr:MAG: hypothetical protein QY306_11310 [Anaerolineales bacterium]
MAAPSSSKEKKAEKPIATDVILIVKGAGEQAEDDHLNIFLRGFWPAIKSLDGNATLSQVASGFEDYVPSPHNSNGKLHKHVTEIRAKYKGRKRRIWLKEAYWESETLPSGGLGNLSREWRMASFVFANMFRNVVFSRNTNDLKKARVGGQGDFDEWWERPGTRITDGIGYYLSYLLLFLLVLGPFFLLSQLLWLNEALKNLLPEALYHAPGFSPLLFMIVIGAVWAVAPAIEHVTLIVRRFKEKELRILPVLPGWTLIALIFLLVSEPVAYIKFILILLALQASLLMARGLLWKLRTYANSDVDIAEYYSYFEDGNPKDKRIGKVDEFWLTRLPFTPLLYRYLIFMILPIGFIGTLLSSLLKWTKFLGGAGASLDKALNVMLVGYMDDVVNYAMDPAQSNRVRSAVINDIIYFHKKEDVERIHVVAHSQGTPITYESLFHFLDTDYQDKIFTYATLGSVLSYYHQARGVLDLVYYERFPVPAAKKHKFPKDFRWMNFWNFSDPITEFYGLDEYTNFKKAPPKDDVYERTLTSPVNIRTRTSLAGNHGEYWNNLDKFTTPLAKRVLGINKPEEWSPDIKPKKETKDTTPRDWAHYRHHVLVLIAWVAILIVSFFAARWLLGASPFHLVSDYFVRLQENAVGVYEHYFPPGDSTTPPELSRLWSQLLDGALLLIGAWMVYDWFAQMVRAIRLMTKLERQ